MPVVNSNVVHIPLDEPPARAFSRQNWHAVRIEFNDIGVVWLVSHEDSIDYLPAGASVLTARIAVGGLPAISKNAGHLSGSATSTNPVYTFADVDESLSLEISEKTQSGIGTNNSKVSEYQWPVGTQCPERYPLITSLFKNHSWSATRGLTIQCIDVNRGLDTTIFAPKQWRISEGITATQSEISITTLVGDIESVRSCMIRHNSSYVSEPNVENVGYIRVDSTGEIIAYTGVEPDGVRVKLTGCIRGRFQTTSRAVLVSINEDEAQFPTLDEWVYIHEERAELVYALITGTFYDRTKTIPSHWSAGLDRSRINGTSFAKAYSGFPFSFQNPGGVDCKSFIEKEILAPTAVLSVNGRGEFQWLTTVFPNALTSTSIVFDETNTVNPQSIELTHVKTELKPYLYISTDYDAQRDQFLSHVPILNFDSADYNKTEDNEFIERRGIHAGLHSNAQIKELGQQYGELLFYEKLGTAVESHLNGIEIGEIVTIKYDYIPDDTTAGAQTINRSVMVVGWSLNRSTNTTTYTVVGTLQIAQSQLSTINDHNLPAEEYRRDGIDIATLPGIVINNGVATGSITLQMGLKYYYVDADEDGSGLEFSNALNVNITGQGLYPSIYVYGPFVNRTIIDVSGRSNYEGGEGATSSTPERVGDTGVLFAPTLANGTIRSVQTYYDGRAQNTKHFSRGPIRRSSIIPLSHVKTGFYARLPVYDIAIHDDKLVGLPLDLGGSAGDGSGRSSFHDAQRRPLVNQVQGDGKPAPTKSPIVILGRNGLKGGRGGGGLLIVSWGGSCTGQIITSGGPAEPDLDTYDEDVNILRSRGGGGRPGGLLWLVDGNWPSPILTDSNVLCMTGEMAMGGEIVNAKVDRDSPVIESNGIVVRDGNYRSGYSNYTIANMREAAARVQFIPANEKVQQKILLPEDRAFANQRDGVIKLHIGDTPPSNADYGDFLITKSQLESTDQFPIARILRNNGEWTLVDWPNEYVTYQWLLKAYRDGEGVRVFNSPDRPAEGRYKNGDLWRDPVARVTWELNTSGEDTIFSRDGVQLGDERLGDPNFVNSQRGEHFWYFSGDPNQLPVFPVAQSGQSIFTFSIDSVSQGFEFLRFNLSPPIQVNALVYSRTSVELFWEFPDDSTNITGYEVFVDGVLVELSTGKSYFTSGFASGTEHTLGVRSVNADGEISNTIETTITTNGDVGDANTGSGAGGVTDTTVQQPRNLQISIFSETNGELTWQPPESNTDGLTGYEVSRDGAILTTVAIGTHSYNMTDLMPQTSYAFELRSVSVSGNKSLPLTVSGTTGDGSSDGGGSSSNAPTLTVDNVVNGNTINGPTISGATTLVEQGRQIFIAHDDGALLAAVQADGRWSVTAPSHYSDEPSISPYVENSSGQPAQDVRSPFIFNMP